MTNWTYTCRCFYNNNICIDLIITRIFMIKTECKFSHSSFLSIESNYPTIITYYLFPLFLSFNILCQIGNLNRANRSHRNLSLARSYIKKWEKKEKYEQITITFSRLYFYVTHTFTSIDRIQTILVITMKDI
jgi:tmRNA-binding protein